MSKDNSSNIITGIFDFIVKDIRKAIKETRMKNDKPVGVGVYTTEYCEENFFTKPYKSLEHRKEIASGLEGVDFVFEVNSKDQEEVENIKNKALNEYLERKNKEEEPKKYKLGFIIGSFDVFHAGHNENIELSSELCDNLYVVLKTDERIEKHKHKTPMQNTTERAKVLKSLKKVQEVLYMDVDSTRTDVLEDVINKFHEQFPNETLDKKEIVAIFGEDLKEKEINREEWDEINLEFTPRPESKMKEVSSTAYQNAIKSKDGGMENIEKKEKQYLQTRLADDEPSTDDEGRG